MESARACGDPQLAVRHVPIHDDAPRSALDRKHAVVLGPVELVAGGGIERAADDRQNAFAQRDECAFVVHRGSFSRVLDFAQFSWMSSTASRCYRVTPSPSSSPRRASLRGAASKGL